MFGGVVYPLYGIILIKKKQNKYYNNTRASKMNNIEQNIQAG